MQLRISLNGIKPKIWRKFLVENSISFKKLHKIIQTVMGWEDCHLYEFCVNGERITPEDEGFNMAEASFRSLHNSQDFLEFMKQQDMSNRHAILDTDKVNAMMDNIRKNKPKQIFSINTKISELLKSEGQKFEYLYDFGDNWEHSIVIEKIMEKDLSIKYPICIAGERVCPPEDCGSVFGYYELMKIRKNKNHPDYEDMIVEWLGEDYDPELFVLDWVNARLHGNKPKASWVIKKDKNEGSKK